MIDKKYLVGEAIYGDNFSIDQINNWYNEEAEAYANLGSKEQNTYEYGYHHLNNFYGYKHIKNQPLNNVLGLGAAWGHEFLPIIDQIKNLHIIEPSDHLRSDQLGTISPIYSKPAIDGTIAYPDGSFDLVTSFGTLHHIPNVSYVLSELIRITRPGGFLLIREPVVSMGDWTKSRPGLTKNERGIPLQQFRNILKQHDVKVLSERLFFCMTPFLERLWAKFSKRPLHTRKWYILVDSFLSKIFANNLHYHATKKSQRIAPQSVYYVLQKL